MKRTGMLYVRRSFCWEGWEGGDYDLEERLGYPRIGECNNITQCSITTLKGEQDGTWHGVLVFGKAIGSSSHGLWQCAREGTHFLGFDSPVDKQVYQSCPVSSEHDGLEDWRIDSVRCASTMTMLSGNNTTYCNVSTIGLGVRDTLSKDFSVPSWSATAGLPSGQSRRWRPMVAQFISQTERQWSRSVGASGVTIDYLGGGMSWSA
ncbi:hypothetical protein EDD15DRAFT_2195621 [Pisolithus albus]|nr:hypothetical protein EDD15DRAFT_2195621 [Pisolithus albus]